MYPDDTVAITSSTRDYKVSVALISGDRQPGRFHPAGRRRPQRRALGVPVPKPPHRALGTDGAGGVPGSGRCDRVRLRNQWREDPAARTYGRGRARRPAWNPRLLGVRSDRPASGEPRLSRPAGELPRLGRLRPRLHEQWLRRVGRPHAGRHHRCHAMGHRDGAGGCRTRVCIMGTSYGGYAALMGVAREPGLYRCAVGQAGIYDLNLMERAGDVRERLSGIRYLRQILGDVDLDTRSPTHLADNIRAKVMLVHGGIDRRAPPMHARRMRDALEKAGHEVTLALRRRPGPRLHRQRGQRGPVPANPRLPSREHALLTGTVPATCDKQVHVALRAVVAPGHRTEDADVAQPAALGQREQSRPVLHEQRGQRGCRSVGGSCHGEAILPARGRPERLAVRVCRPGQVAGPVWVGRRAYSSPVSGSSAGPACGAVRRPCGPRAGWDR